MNNDINNQQVPAQPQAAAPQQPVQPIPAAPAPAQAAQVPVAQPAPAQAAAVPVAQPVPAVEQPQSVVQQGPPTAMTPEEVFNQPPAPPVQPNPMQQMTPVDNQPQQPEEPPKKKSKLPVLLLIIVLLLGVCGFVYKDTIMNMISPKQETTKKETTKEKETTVSDSLKAELNKKIGRLLYNEDLLDNHSAINYGFRSFVLTKELTDDEKEFIVLETTKYDKVDDVWEKIPDIKTFITKEQETVTATGTTYNLNGAIAEFGVKSQADIAKDFKSLFGTEFKIAKEKLGSCPTYQYNKDEDVFFHYPARCGGTSGESILYYVNAYNRDGDTIEVHMNFGVVSENKVYGDFDIEKVEGGSEYAYRAVPKTEVTTEEKDANGAPVINEKNSKDFSEYVLTFKKATDGTFYFVSSKKVTQ